MNDSTDVLIAVINQAGIWVPIVTAIGSALAGIAVWFYRKRIRHEIAASDAALLESLCRNAVAWVEQTVRRAQDESDADYAARRLDTAVHWVVERSHALGLDVTEKQVYVFVEAAVLGLKNPFPVTMLEGTTPA